MCLIAGGKGLDDGQQADAEAERQTQDDGEGRVFLDIADPLDAFRQPDCEGGRYSGSDQESREPATAARRVDLEEEKGGRETRNGGVAGDIPNQGSLTQQKKRPHDASGDPQQDRSREDHAGRVVQETGRSLREHERTQARHDRGLSRLS